MGQVKHWHTELGGVEKKKERKISLIGRKKKTQLGVKEDRK